MTDAAPSSDLNSLLLAQEEQVFYPSRPDHRVVSVILEPPASLSADVLAPLWRATRLSDAIRSVQCLQSDAVACQRPLSVLREEAAGCLEAAARGLTCAASARALHLRAGLLRSDQLPPTQGELYTLHERQMVALCGPLQTWHGKTRRALHSALFAAPEAPLELCVAQADARLAAAAEFLRHAVDPRIAITSPPGIRFVNLFFCGGEANRYPKHFAHFLPEDEGVKCARTRRTLVFANIYLAMVQRVTFPLVERTLELGQAPGLIPDASLLQCLALWFRGHDTGHGVRFPETDYRVLRRQGRWESMVVQETLADAFGYLLAAGSVWSGVVDRAHRFSAAEIFLAEMLRYLRRGGDKFPDAAAASIELQFLVDRNFLFVDSHRRTLVTTPELVLEGMRCLATELGRVALGNDEQGTACFLHRYLRPDDDLPQVVRALPCCTQVLDYIQRPVVQLQTSPVATVGHTSNVPQPA